MSSDSFSVIAADPMAPAVALAAYLASQREAILECWAKEVANDAALSSPDGLSRTEFRDDIPAVLKQFEERLRQETAPGPASSDASHLNNATEHGEHRWKQGYDLREVILEWGHLHRCLLDALDAASDEALSNVTDETFAVARRILARMIETAIADSAEQFALLQQKEAINTCSELERTVAGFIEDGQRRAALWRESAHDLRGQLSIITSATALLEEPSLEEALHAESVGMLQKGTTSLKEMLQDVLESAQTEAVREECHLSKFDATSLLGGLCAASQPLARERNLALRSSGPESLPVEGDRGKVLRIAQNLLLNALSYTPEGTVSVSCQEEDSAWWSFQVRDTGPGLPTAAGGPGERRSDRPGGEGIGLSIVRRLTDTLGARLSVETASGSGTVFTVTFPRRYAAI